MKIKLKLALASSLIALSSSFLLLPQAFAASSVIYISPPSQNQPKNSLFTVQLRIDPTTPTNSVQATVAYNPALLAFDYSSPGVFPCTTDGGGSGMLNFVCSSTTDYTSSDTLIATITFTAIASSGSTSLIVSNQAAYTYLGFGINPTATSGTVNLEAAASSQAPPAPTKTSGTTTTTTTKTTTTVPTKSSTTPTAQSATTSQSSISTFTPTTAAIPDLVISAEKGTAQYTNAQISFHSNMPIKAYVKYGTNENKLNLTSKTFVSKPDGSLIISGLKLKPGQLYYYQTYYLSGSIVAKSSVTTLLAKGYDAVVTVYDKNHHLVRNTVFTLHSSTPIFATTNYDGVAVFENVMPGLHHLQYTSKKVTYSEPLHVANNFVNKEGSQTSKPQKLSVVLTSYTLPGSDYHSTFSDILTSLLFTIIFGVILGALNALVDWHITKKHYSWKQIKNLAESHHLHFK